jgi:serine/threonine-protein kinase HipA
MARRANTLAVWINGIHAADWNVTQSKGDELQYTGDWVSSKAGRPLSISLPFNLDNAPVRGERVRYYFDNLLPDSAVIRQRIQLRYRSRTQDPFDLLAAVGRECVGAVQLLPPGEAPKDVRSTQFETLTDRDIEKALKQITAPAGPAGQDDDGLRISIAGAQEKSAFLLDNGRWCRPMSSTPTTHIFKLPLGLIGGIQADMTGSVENEWLCSRILHHYGLPVANCAIGRFGDEKVLIVERFDRQFHKPGGFWMRLVQEDFCQALAIPSSLKYERDGGPGILEIAGILRNSANRDIDLITLLKSQIVFWLLAAGDGHAKNFSLRMLAGGRFTLTPLYDVLSYWPIIGTGPDKYPYQKARLAMALRGKNKHYALSEIHRRHFNETAAKMGVGDAEGSIQDIVTRTPHVLHQLGDELPKSFPKSISEPILSGLKTSAESLQGMAE